MKEVVVISGKGGTGKTSLAASLAALAGNAVIADCDVDASDLHLVLSPRIERREEFKSGREAVIRPDACIACGLCQQECRFHAIHAIRRKGRVSAFYVDPFSCEGCGVCAALCPEKAITMVDKLSGHWFVSDTRTGPMVHARLGIAEDNSGKLVSQVRQEAKRLAEEKDFNYVIVDGPPGIGCPVIAAIGGVDLVLIVTEPTALDICLAHKGFAWFEVTTKGRAAPAP